MANKPITPEEMKAYVDATWEKCQAEAWQEPVAWRITDGEGDYEYCTDLPEDWSIQWSARYGRKYEPLYTAPRQWQGLTDDEKRSLVEWAHPDIIEAIELKLRERNGG